MSDSAAGAQPTADRQLWLLTNVPTRLEIPALSEPAAICTRYLKRLEGLLGRN